MSISLDILYALWCAPNFPSRSNAMASGRVLPTATTDQGFQSTIAPHNTPRMTTTAVPNTFVSLMTGELIGERDPEVEVEAVGAVEAEVELPLDGAAVTLPALLAVPVPTVVLLLGI